MPIESTVPVGGQQDPVIPVVQPSKEEATKADTIKVWTGRFSKSEAFLKPYFERDQQAFEFWYMWREFRGPYRANIFPPDVHAGVESITPRLTKGRAKVIVKSRGGIEGEHLLRVQRAHDAYWDFYMNLNENAQGEAAGAHVSARRSQPDGPAGSQAGSR